jgi:hypothetical protein
MSEFDDLKRYSLEELQSELKFRSNKRTGSKAINKRGRHTGLTSVNDFNIIKAVVEKQRVIYGVDDRQDLYEVTNKRYLDAAKSVVALFNKQQVSDMGDGTSELALTNYGEEQDLCASEKFRDQPVGAFCSGFLVAPQIIATAGHCINSTNVQDVRFVFGFKMNAPGDPTTKINNSQIYKGSRIIGHELTDNGPDWALVELDRPVQDHPVVKIRTKGKIEDKSPVYVIGHPSGLPMKVAGGAIVRDNSNSDFMVCNLDTYGGNSGSPVFSDGDEEEPFVEGILVRGETDFTPVGDCNVSMGCPTSGCRGEDVTRTTLFADKLSS